MEFKRTRKKNSKLEQFFKKTVKVVRLYYLYHIYMYMLQHAVAQIF